VLYFADDDVASKPGKGDDQCQVFARLRIAALYVAACVLDRINFTDELFLSFQSFRSFL
jgi:hypothetical protein